MFRGFMSLLRKVALAGAMYVAACSAYAKDETLPELIANAKSQYSEFANGFNFQKIVPSIKDKLNSQPNKEISLTTKLEEGVTFSGSIKLDGKNKVKITLTSTAGPESASITAVDTGNLACFDAKDTIRGTYGGLNFEWNSATGNHSSNYAADFIFKMAYVFAADILLSNEEKEAFMPTMPSYKSIISAPTSPKKQNKKKITSK